jgi:hypothetical protein
MKKKSDKHLITISLFLILFLPLVSSASPFITTEENSLLIEHPYQETIKAGQDYHFHFHVFNVSDNYKSVNMSLVTCSFHLYNSSGNHIFKNNYGVGSDDVLDYEQIILGGNFTKNKYYGFVFQCNSSGETGVYEATFYVTENGDSINTGIGLIYFLVTIFAFGIFFLLGWIFLNIEGENPKDDTGYLGINYKKYIKTAMFPLVYVSFLWAYNFIIGLSNNYLGLTLYSNTLEFIFMILTKLVYPIIVITFIIEIVLLVKDSNIEKEYKSLWSPY